MKPEAGEAKRPKKKTPTKKTRRKSSKGALIKGASRPLPIDLLYEPSFRQGLQDMMKGYSGIYLLYRRKSLYYIGLAKNLHGRLLSHTKNKHKDKWDSFVVFRIEDVDYLKDIETLLLRVATPPGNSVSGHFHRDADLTKVLRRIQAEQMRKLKHIKKILK